MILGHIGGAASAFYNYMISKSVRFRSAVNAYMTRTPQAGGSQTRMTWSFWVKPSLAKQNTLIGCAISGSQIDCIGFDNGFGYGTERLHFAVLQGSFIGNLLTTRRFRDPTAWYHIVVVWDTPNATASDRMRMYINGVRETAFDVASYPAQNATMVYWNSSSYVNHINQLGPNYGSLHSDVYLAEFNFIDGQALDASYFGEFESTSGTWVAKKYTGTYGTTGFYLDFKTGTNLTTLTQDKSGNSNNWTAVNVSLTAGATYDWMDDTPTNNFAVLNPLDKHTSGITLSNGNLTIGNASTGYNSCRSTLGMTTGKWYMEFVVTAWGDVTRTGCGLYTATDPLNSSGGGTATSWGYQGNGFAYNNTAPTALSTGAYTTGDIIMMAFDADAGKIWFGKNGTWNGDPAVGTGNTYGSLTATPYFFGGWSYNSSDSTSVNFGQRPFVYTPPSGYKSLCSSNLPEPGIAASEPYKHFGIKLHTGNNSSQNISGVAFAPDFVWIKARNSAQNHALFDRNRGVQQLLTSNATDAEVTASTSLTAFNSDGITVAGDNRTGSNAITYVDWMWKAGGAAVANNSGSIASQVSANPAAGFSIVTYTGNGANATVGHGLGVKPKLVIVKMRGGVTNWCVWHDNLTLGNSLYLNLTNGQGADAAVWNSTAPTSSVFSVGTNVATNQNTIQYVAYCFAEVPGFSKIGRYTGNGSADGPLVWCGFRPRFVMYKRIDSTGNWYIEDAARNAYNVVNISLSTNLSAADYNGGGNEIDFLANGFKFRTASADQNASNGTYIFMAFAEAPFKYANAR